MSVDRIDVRVDRIDVSVDWTDASADRMFVVFFLKFATQLFLMLCLSEKEMCCLCASVPRAVRCEEREEVPGGTQRA